MEYRRARQARGVDDEEFRASSNTPVRPAVEAEGDAQARVIEDLRHELEVVKAREQRMVESYERRIRELEAIHKADVALLLEESKRTNDALVCIRGLCDFQQTSDREDSPCADDLLAAVLSEAAALEEAGSPVQIGTMGGMGCGMTSDGASVGERGDDVTVVHEVLVEDDTRTEDGDVASIVDSLCSLDSMSDRSVIYSRQDDDVQVKDSFCPIRDYRGENPGVLTENNLDRILDHPTSTFQGNTASRSRSPHVHGAIVKEKEQSRERVRAQDVESPSAWKIPSVHTRTRLLVEDLERKLKNRQAALERKDATDTEKRGDQMLHGTSSVEADHAADEDVETGQGLLSLDPEDEFVRTIRALGDSSPTTANLLTQHVSDSWVQKYAAKPSFASGNAAANKVTSSSSRSSFLKRSPISLTEVFSSSSPLWATRLSC